MFKRFVLAIALLFFSYGIPAAKVTLSVMDLSASGVTQDEAKTLTSQLMAKLTSSRTGFGGGIRAWRESWFTLVATEKRDKILKEWAFQQTGVCDQASCIAEFGKALGVQMMLGGNVGRIGETYSLNLILVDVATAEVKESFTRSGGCQNMDCFSFWVPSLADEIILGSYAEKVCRKAIQRSPNDADAHNNLGLALEYNERLGKGSGSSTGIFAPVGLMPDHSPIPDEAIKEFRKAIQLDPAFVEAHFNIGGGLEVGGNYLDAEKEYQVVMRLNPMLGKKGFVWLGLGRYNYGVALREQGRTEEAIAAFRESIRLNSWFGAAYDNLGLELAEKNEYKEAEEVLRKAIFMDTRDAGHFECLGTVLDKQGKRQEARTYYLKARKFETDPARIKLIDGRLAEPD